MKIRFAKVSDADEVADVHFRCSQNQEMGFMFKLGKGFFRQYYRVLLNERNSIVLVAEDNNHRIIGLSTGSLQTEEHLVALKKHKLRFLFVTLLQIMRHPNLIYQIIIRQKNISNGQGNNGFIAMSGARLEYWGWLPDHKESMGAVELLRCWLAVVRQLGAVRVNHEIDVGNTKSEQIHKLLGSKVVGSFFTTDGRERLMMEYDLSVK